LGAKENGVREFVDRILYTTDDPETQLDGCPVPAMTTMLHRVCGNDEAKFHEAMRLVELFIRAALAAPGR